MLSIGAFAQPAEDRSEADTWLVTWHLIHYVSAIAGSFDRLQRIRQATVEASARTARAPEPVPVEIPRAAVAEAESGPSYWARAAAAAKSGRPAESEAELTARGFVERAHEEIRDEVISTETENDNSVVHPDWTAPRKGREAATG